MQVEVDGIKITLTNEQMAEIAAQQASKPTELNGGDWCILGNGFIDKIYILEDRYDKFGVTFPTEKIAIRMRNQMRKDNRLRALIYQLDPDFIDAFDYTKHCNTPENESYYLYINNGKWKFKYSTNCRHYGIPSMKYSTAEEVCRLLNSGEFVL